MLLNERAEDALKILQTVWANRERSHKRGMSDSQIRGHLGFFLAMVGDPVDEPLDTAVSTLEDAITHLEDAVKEELEGDQLSAFKHPHLIRRLETASRKIDDLLWEKDTEDWDDDDFDRPGAFLDD